MRLILFLVGGIWLGHIIAATWIWPPSNGASGLLLPTTNSATGQDPWMASEIYMTGGRDNIRQGMLKTLEQAWAVYCTPDGHKDLINSVNNYYYQREGEVWSKVNTYGERARQFAIEVWSTTDDNRIERLIGETYGRGYFALKELEPRARTHLTAQMKVVQVVAKPCSG